MLAIDETDRIIEVGQSISSSEVDVEYFEGALCPGFINTHCHLELSYLKDKVPSQTGLPGFIQNLQSVRQADEDIIQAGIIDADLAMQKEGIVAVGDISNGESSFQIKSTSPLYYHTFLELFAFDPAQAVPALKRGQELRSKAVNLVIASSIVPHSPYSVSKKLFSLISKLDDNQPLSIHNQETSSENDLYKNKSGKIMEMLDRFGLDTSRFELSGKSSLASYLEFLPKESNLLLVHNTYTTDEDLEMAEINCRKLFWCFCPKANLYIENRLPQINNFYDRNLRCTIGTDSLASNDKLSILDELRVIQTHFPTIPLDVLIQWATINGATFLGLNDSLGSFEVGKKAKVNWLKNVREEKLTNDSVVQPVN